MHWAPRVGRLCTAENFSADTYVAPIGYGGGTAVSAESGLLVQVMHFWELGRASEKLLYAFTRPSLRNVLKTGEIHSTARKRLSREPNA